MRQSDWLRIRDLFERAIDQSPPNVRAWLDREADGDLDVQAEVMSLLEHHRRAGAFLTEPPDIELDPADDPPLEPGRVIGPYTIVREAGRGGMGRVYAATDARLGRIVALKAVRALTDPAQRERLRREARAAAVLTHPGICTVYALEEIDDHLFIATEFIEGRTLRQEIESGDRPTGSDLLATAREIAEALAVAHKTGMTHGDLKPENVMRIPNGRLKILDFGLARPEGRTSPERQTLSDTQPGMIVGTPGYMAPEQLNGGARDIRGDVFAFGVLMYEYACGTHPFDASTPVGMTARVLEGHVRPIEEIRTDLPSALGIVIERCLRKLAADRFPSAVQIVECLAREDGTAPRARVATWWRAHQFIIIGLYLVASIAAWRVRELHGGVTTAVFLAIGVSATVATVFRGHLLFTERMNGSRLTAERRRTRPVTMGVDLLISLALAVDGAIIASITPLPAVLIVSLSASLALARLILEPSTTAAAFKDQSGR